MWSHVQAACPKSLHQYLTNQVTCPKCCFIPTTAHLCIGGEDNEGKATGDTITAHDLTTNNTPKLGEIR